MRESLGSTSDRRNPLPSVTRYGSRSFSISLRRSLRLRFFRRGWDAGALGSFSSGGTSTGVLMGAAPFGGDFDAAQASVSSLAAGHRPCYPETAGGGGSSFGRTAVLSASSSESSGRLPLRMRLET